MSRSRIDNDVIKVRNLSVSFKNSQESVTVIHNISFDIGAQEFVGIVGESGSGKSVTSRVLMGLLSSNAHIKAQKLTVLNKDVLSFQKKDWLRFRGSEIALIFQEPMSSLNPTICCGKQVAEILELHTQLSPSQIKKEVLYLFKKVKLPSPEKTYHKYPHEISGGQMQRVMIAMAVACKPKILIADEPTTALDVTVQNQIINLLRELQEEYGMSVVFISHDLALVRSIAHRIVVMYQGKIVEQGTPHRIFNQPNEDYTKALIAARPDNGVRLKKLPTIADYLNDTVHHEYIDEATRRSHHEQLYSQSPILQVRHVVKDYKLKNNLFKRQHYFRALDDVSLDIYPKESLGLVGESGCGKTTLGNCILRLKDVTSGQIFFNGQDITNLTGAAMRRLRKDIQIIFQDPFASLNPRLTIGEAILEPMEWHGIGKDKLERKDKVVKILNRVGLGEAQYNRYPHEFSGGQRQRIGIARTIAIEPRLIVCDESVSALDISVQAQVLNLLNELKEDFDFSYLFISHDLAVVKYFCDRVVVMNKGKIEEYGEADQVYNNPQSAYTKKLIAAIPK